MKVAEGQQQDDLMEIIEDRLEWKATIVASQLPVSKLFDPIGKEVIAYAVLTLHIDFTKTNNSIKHLFDLHAFTTILADPIKA